MTKPWKAAVAQIASVPDDSVATAHKAAEVIRRAAREGARLIVFPEALLGGYPKGASFGCPVGVRKPEGRQAFHQYYNAAIDLNGEEVSIIAEATAETDTFIVIGCIERDGGTLYCTALFFDGARGLIGKHRKLMPTAGGRLIWGFGDGSTMPVFETPLGRIGAVICCAPTADDRDTWLPSMRHIALEGRCFVLTACQYITRGAFPADHESALGDEPDTVMMRGGSAIINPLGKVLTGPDFSGETILYADIDLAEVARGKFDFDVVGHYARPDIFQLHVDDRPKNAVNRLSQREK